MALTLEVEQRLERVGLVRHFSDNEKAWTAAAQDAYDYLKKGFGGRVTRYLPAYDRVYMPPLYALWQRVSRG